MSKSAQIIQEILLKKEMQVKVVELPTSTRTADDAAKAIGCTVGQIIKSLIFRTKHTHKPVLVLASGSNRVNEKTVSHHVGEEIVKAGADYTREVTGFVIGGIPPIGHKQDIPTFIDEDLCDNYGLWRQSSRGPEHLE